jgi:lipopolysaccharide exporter
VMMMFDYVRDLGVAVALVQRPEPWSRLAPTGLTLSTGFGLLVGALAAVTAPWTAAALGDPELVALVRVLAIGLVISALGVLPMAILRRRLDFRRRMWPEVVGAGVKTAVAIGLAAGGHGVWSLVWAQLAASVVTTVGYWVVVRPPLRFGFDRAIAGALVRFGLPVTAVSFLSFAVTSVDYAAIGRRLGSEELGYYTLAYRLPELLVINMCIVVGDVLFSALSRLQHDRPALIGKYLATLRAVVALTAAIGFGMAVVAPDLISVLYGAQFAAATDELAVLALFAVLYSVNFHAGDAYKAIGRPWLLTWLGAGKLAMLAPAVWWAAGRSALLVAVALVAVELVMTVIRLALVRRVLGVGIGRHLAVLGGPVTAAAAMATVVWGTSYGLPDWPGAVRLALLVLVGVVAYLGLLRLFAPSLWHAAARVLRHRHRRQEPRERMTAR